MLISIHFKQQHICAWVLSPRAAGFCSTFSPGALVNLRSTVFFQKGK